MRLYRKRLSAMTVVSTAAAFTLLAPMAAAHASTSYFYEFHKNTNLSSTLTMYKDPGTGVGPSVVRSWRAGSGTTTDPCATGKGWLPNGTYSVTAAYLNHTGTVEGPALQLSDHKCSGGTLRTELFIHSSYPWSSSHYYSNGCIKLSNTGGPSPASGDIKDMYNLYSSASPHPATVNVYGP